MYKFSITNGYLNIQITTNGNQVLNIPKVIVASNFLELYRDNPIVSLYNSTCDNQTVFQKPLSECVDSNDVPFTVDSLIEFCQENLGFNLPEVPGNITVVNDYNALPSPTTVPDEFYWCQNAVSGYPVGLYYSNGITWEYASSTNINVVANYSALPNPTTVPDTFYWCENSQGTSWLPGSFGGTYYNSGLYYSNGVSWSYMNVPYQATQNAVDAGLIDNQFLTPLTFTNAQQLKAIVVSSNTTAILNRIHNVTANATLTDATPVEGMGYMVNVINGVATVGGVTYPVGSQLFRSYHSGSWKTFEYLNSNKVEEFIFSDGENVLGTHTGDTLETVLFSIPISGNEYLAGDWTNWLFNFQRTGGSITVRFRVGTTGTNADTLAATYNINQVWAGISRFRWQFPTNGTLYVVNASATSITDLTGASSLTSIALDITNNWFLTCTVQNTNNTDVVSCDGGRISKIKKI